MMLLVASLKSPTLETASRWTLVGSREFRTVSMAVSRGSPSAVQDRFRAEIDKQRNQASAYSKIPFRVPAQVRFFAATPGNKKEEDTKEEEEGSLMSRTFRSVLTPQNQFYALVAGGSIGAAKWGFYTGFGCATVVGGLALVTFDNMYIRADPVYRYCLNWVQNDAYILKQLGDGLQPGNLRSYRLDAGKLEVAGRSVVWRPPRIQMIFDITAQGPPYRTGIVTCEAVKAGGFPPRLQTTLLKIDYELGNEGEEGGTREDDETYFLVGSQEDVSRVSQRSGLSLDMLGRSVHIEKAAAGRQNQ